MSGPVTRAVAGRLAWQAGSTAAGIVASSLLPPLDDDRHPVARFGRAMTSLERVLWRDDHLAGVLYTAIGVALGASRGAAVPTVRAVSLTVAGAQLRREARRVAAALEQDHPDQARAALRSLVGRDTSSLDTSGMAAAAIESVAENMVDAVFAPALWAAFGGAAGAGAYRAINTMDAMVGHRTERYARFGWSSARLDDVANLVPARLFGLAVATVTPTRVGPILDAIVRDAPGHPSPNAGVAEAAMAGALGVELGGPLRYGTLDEDRPTLGSGPRPVIADIDRAIRVAEHTEALLVAWLAALSLGSAGVAALPGGLLP